MLKNEREAGFSAVVSLESCRHSHGEYSHHPHSQTEAHDLVFNNPQDFIYSLHATSSYGIRSQRCHIRPNHTYSNLSNNKARTSFSLHACSLFWNKLFDVRDHDEQHSARSLLYHQVRVQQRLRLYLPSVPDTCVSEQARHGVVIFTGAVHYGASERSQANPA